MHWHSWSVDINSSLKELLTVPEILDAPVGTYRKHQSWQSPLMAMTISKRCDHAIPSDSIVAQVIIY